MSLINVTQLQSYLDHGLNVLLEGQAGVGKSSAILKAFADKKYKYFSAPTMDPWVDFIGAPKDVHSEKHGTHVLTLVRPEWVLDADVEVIFFDELNRASPKVLDATMELIQFKSINGFKLPKLKAIWGAINPADETGKYKVEELDFALRDRFEVQIVVPYKIDEQYFHSKYPETAAIFCDWWKTLPIDIKNEITPRRMEYVAKAFSNGLPLTDFLPVNAPISQLRKALRMQPFHTQLEEIDSDDKAAEFLKKVNNSTQLLDLVKLKDKRALEFFKIYQHVMPREFVESVAPRVKMIESGEEVIMSFEDMLRAIKKNKYKPGTVAITEMVNNAEFKLFEQKGISLLQAVESAIKNQPVGWTELVNHLFKLYSSETAQVMNEASKKNGDRTNLLSTFMAIISADAKRLEVWDVKQRKKMSDHMFFHKIIGNKWQN